ncbi:MAG: M28 family peptidase [Verrucomicrobiota bacterium]
MAEAAKEEGSGPADESDDGAMAPNPLIRWFLVGLPVGFVLVSVLVGLSTWFSDGTLAEAQPKKISLGSMNQGQVGTEILLRDYVETLTVTIGERHFQRPRSLKAAQLFLESTLGPSNLGYAPRRHIYKVDGESFTNIEAVLSGEGPTSREVIVVGAHYDTAAGTPGADDNASGVAVLLALAKRFAGKPQKRTIHWVGFTNEEPPWFQGEGMGSLRYAKDLQQRGVPVKAMISLESLGYFSDERGSQRYPEPLAAMYPDTGNFIAVVGNLKSRRLVDFSHRILEQGGIIPVEKGAFPEMIQGIGWSDHWSFWQVGVPAVMLTDTAPFRNPHYHQSTDTIHELDFPRMALAVSAIQELVIRLAEETW